MSFLLFLPVFLCNFSSGFLLLFWWFCLLQHNAFRISVVHPRFWWSVASVSDVSSFISFHVSSDSRFFPFYYFYNLWKYSNALLWCFQLLQTCFRQKYRYCASCIGLSPRHYHLLWVRNIESPTDCSYLFSNALIWLCDSCRAIPMKTCWLFDWKALLLRINALRHHFLNSTQLILNFE